ncbi:cytochrome c family protein [Sandarakinorhabdus sp.]|uniref:c-type cytochrome n=1 Tax=Sandarakinorhabdus sp. TaxID=1916663 RepID=UPI00286E1EA0|nr:cytochrome c family protein [Sandarakinorhabdus sp.]
MQIKTMTGTVFSAALLSLLAACGSSETKAPSPTEAPADTSAMPEAAAPAPAAPAAAPASAPTATPGSAPAAIDPSAAGAVTLASLTGDAAKGEKVFAQCKACHVAEPGVNRVGPSLHGVVGRTAGTVAGFKYSIANKSSGVTWAPDVLFTYLEAPQKFMPGTRMAFAGLKKPQDRADVIAYLKTKA